jgi:D-sedoheptulose 7-phosphate isomerase
MMFSSTAYFEKLKRTMNAFPHGSFDSLIVSLKSALENGRQVILMGNGGSAATASHWACDLNKGCSLFSGDCKRFRAICLNDNVATLLAYANDLAYSEVFVEQLKNFLQPNDLVIGISGSGNSVNVIKALEYASENGASTAALVGFDGGRLARIAKLTVHVAVSDMQVVEDMHCIVMHMTMQALLEHQQDRVSPPNKACAAALQD